MLPGRESAILIAFIVLAIDAGHMRSSTAAGLVGAAMLSTLVYPFVAMALRKDALEEESERPEPTGPFPEGEGSIPQPGLIG